MQVSEANLIGSGTSEHWVDDEGPQPKKVKVSRPRRGGWPARIGPILFVSFPEPREHQGPVEH